MVEHLLEYCGTTNDTEMKILDACRLVEKLMTIEAIYISNLKPAIYTRDEYSGNSRKNLTSNHNFDFRTIHRAKNVLCMTKRILQNLLKRVT